MKLVSDHVTLTVPGTSANLGAGFDALGLALEIRDRIIVHAVAGPTEVTVRGEGADTVETGESNLIVRAIRVGLEYCGAPQVGIRLMSHNSIPHSRGMGSSAAATVVGLVAARELVADPAALDDESILQLATDFEGHPDNAAPALYGGARLAWMEDGHAHSIPLEFAQSLRPVILIPPQAASTSKARASLPATVPHADAVFNLQRAALMVEALRSGDPALLMTATGDRLHQNYRREVYPQSLELVENLRARGIPAAISGAGSTVLSFGAPDDALRAALVKHGWRVNEVSIATEGVRRGVN